MSFVHMSHTQQCVWLQDMTVTMFKKLCQFGSRYVRFDVLPYRSMYPDAKEKEFLTKYVGSVYYTLVYRVV